MAPSTQPQGKRRGASHTCSTFLRPRRVTRQLKKVPVVHWALLKICISMSVEKEICSLALYFLPLVRGRCDQKSVAGLFLTYILLCRSNIRISAYWYPSSYLLDSVGIEDHLLDRTLYVSDLQEHFTFSVRFFYPFLC